MSNTKPKDIAKKLKGTTQYLIQYGSKPNDLKLDMLSAEEYEKFKADTDWWTANYIVYEVTIQKVITVAKKVSPEFKEL
jgi:hypothetical protein